MSKLRIIFFLPILISLFSCERDEEIITDGNVMLRFSADTVLFDTVFTTIGSATKRIKIYNPANKPVIIKSVMLQGGSQSAYIINIDGEKGPVINQLRIEPKDSIYGFVQVFVDPTQQLSPLLIEDSLIFWLSDNKKQSIKLISYGQDIHLLRDSIITANETWINDKPYVIYGAVIIDSLASLDIEQGCKIYFHRNAWMGVYGTLRINGTMDKPVIFRGDRLDKSNYAPPVPYDKIPGQWEGIRFANSSINNKISYAEIRNATFGIIAGVYQYPGQTQLEIDNTKIYNHSSVGLLAIKAKIKAYNCIFANGEWASFAAFQGGEYEFYHCTFANYPSFGIRSGLAVYLANFATFDTVPGDSKTRKTYFGDLNKAYFGNCIIYGSIENTLELAKHNDYKFEYFFDYCLIKATNDKFNFGDANHFNKNKISNKDGSAVFAKIDETQYQYNFHLSKASLARESGSNSIAMQYPFDLDGKSRLNDDSPDMGAYEFYQEK